MFTWICSQCGNAVDVAEDVCPHCASRSTETTAEPSSSRVPEIAPTQPDPSTESRAEPKPSLRTKAVSERSSTRVPEAARSEVSTGGFHLRAWHYLVFVGGLAVAMLFAVWLSGGLSGLRFEDPEESPESPVETFAIGVRGPIEVSAIRPYYDDDYQTHVRAFVANHSKREQSVALRASLRVREASRQAPPLATFDVVISAPLPPDGGQEVDVQLRAMGSLQSLPPWNEMRVDLEVLGGSGD